MSCIGRLLNIEGMKGSLRRATLSAAIALALMSMCTLVVFGIGDVPTESMAGVTPQVQDTDGPDANLPYLFAVFIITWAAFFGYVFYMSRRQREMQREIEALERALAASRAAENAPESTHSP